MAPSRWTAVLWGLTLFGAACAHGPSTQRQQAYFECAKVPVSVAQANLQRGGYKLAETEDPTHIQTGWTEYKVRQDGAQQHMMFRIKADATKSGLLFSIWAPIEDGEMAWQGITEHQLKEDTHRALLNKIRRDVCGGTADFFEDP